jgi:hypothetical protein
MNINLEYGYLSADGCEWWSVGFGDFPLWKDTPVPIGKEGEWVLEPVLISDRKITASAMNQAMAAQSTASPFAE